MTHSDARLTALDRLAIDSGFSGVVRVDTLDNLSDRPMFERARSVTRRAATRGR